MKRALSIIMVLAMLAAICVAPVLSAEAKKSYSDVKEKNWFYEVVMYVSDKGLMTGVGGNRFDPNGTMSRAMFVTVLGRMCGAFEEETDAFTDVKHGTWYSGYVGWANETGVVKGYNDNTFKPNAPVSRQEAAIMISRYIDYLSILLDRPNGGADNYKDSAKIASWSFDHVDRLSKIGIINGDNAGNFNPRSSITRAEAAAMITRLDKAAVKAATAQQTVSAYDIINTPQMFYSNMDSNLVGEGTASVISLTPHEYYSAPWYVGIDYTEADFTVSALKYVKICIKSEDASAEPYLTVTSPVYDSGKIAPVSVGTEDGYTTAVFETGSLVLAHRDAYLNAETDFTGTLKYIDLNLELLHGTYLRFAVFPFGDAESPTAELRYLAFFADEAAAKAYTAASDADYFANGTDEYPEADIRQDDGTFRAEYMQAMEDKSESIFNSENTYSPEDISGTCYYISSVNGDDSNKGTSPDSPWKSIDKLYTFYAGDTVRVSNLNPGDAVFLERGSVFYSSKRLYGEAVLTGEAGVTYTAYGEGKKPVLTQALDYEGSMDWESTDYENIWKLSGSPMARNETSTRFYDVGNIIITDKDGNLGWGVKIFPAEDTGNGMMSSGHGLVTNGFETYEVVSVPCNGPDVLRHNLEFFHDPSDGELYMYYDGGNPGEVFEKIIVSKGLSIVRGDAKNIVYDNISFEYTGEHGIDMGGADRFTVQNCVFLWIGGSQQGNTQLGNAVQNWGNCQEMTVKDCYFDQVLDACVTFQINWVDESVVNGFYTDGCVMKNACIPVEMWNLARKEITANVRVAGNYFYNEPTEKRFGIQRTYHFTDFVEGKNYRNSVYLALSSLDMLTIEDFVVENNVFFLDNGRAYSSRQFIYRGDGNGTLVRNNVYFGGIEDRSDIFASLPDVDLRNSDYPPNTYDIRPLYRFYDSEFLNLWTSLGCDRGSIFYFDAE